MTHVTNKIGFCAQNIDIILGSTITTTGRTYMISQKEKSFFTLISTSPLIVYNWSRLLWNGFPLMWTETWAKALVLLHVIFESTIWRWKIGWFCQELCFGRDYGINCKFHSGKINIHQALNLFCRDTICICTWNKNIFSQKFSCCLQFQCQKFKKCSKLRCTLSLKLAQFHRKLQSFFFFKHK